MFLGALVRIGGTLLSWVATRAVWSMVRKRASHYGAGQVAVDLLRSNVSRKYGGFSREPRRKPKRRH